MTVVEQGTGPGVVPSIATLWASTDARAWNDALARYWAFVKEDNLELEKRLDKLDLDRLRQMNARQWYEFLRDEYFCWKYTQPNRYASTTKLLRAYEDNGSLGDLDGIRRRLLGLNSADVGTAMEAARAIRGLGPAGASGLLALMFPQYFGTVDQFVVKALRGVPGLPEAATLQCMKPASLTIANSVVLMGILRRKAAENNRVLGSKAWTPRKIDMVLWTYGRGPDCR